MNINRKRNSKYTLIYSTGKEWCIRLGQLETNVFPHGIALATTFPHDKLEECVKFADKVDDYIKQFVEVNK